jgi:glutaconate CoA-transferase subunit A
MLALGGMTLYRRPMAFVRSLIRRYLETGRPGGLTLLNFTAGMESDLLLGAGMIDTLRTCYFGLEIFGLAPMFTHLANLGKINIIEETEGSIALGLRAGMSGIGFMPGRGWIGTDLPGLRSDVKTILDPYTGEELTAFPAIKPDLAVIHAITADREGNAVIGDNKAIDNELALVSDQVIVTTEKVVDKLERVDLIAPLITAVVHTPGGAKPSSCHPLYPLDGLAILEYVETVSNPATCQAYIERWLAAESASEGH